jgi:hypothetical protein
MRFGRGTLHVIWTTLAIGVLPVVSLRAHHSFAPYEPTVQIKLSGVVTDFKWGNPHVYVEVDATDAKSGDKRHWLIECASTSILNRAGWRFNLLKPGDKVTMVVSPLRNGEPAALLKLMMLADGKKYPNGAAAGTATIE